MLRFAAVTVALAGCGRISFDVRGDGNAGASDTPVIDVPLGVVAYVKPFAQRHPGAGATDSFNVQASAAGNAVVVQVACAEATTPTFVDLTAPGWTFTKLTPTDSIGNLHGALYVAIAPDTASTTVTVTWTGVTCSGGKSELGDELTNNDPRGGNITFAAFTTMVGASNNCTSTLTTMHDNAAIWSACFTSGTATAVGAGYTKGADNGGGDWAEYKITMDPSGTVETPTFTNAISWVASTVTIRPL